MNTTSMDDNQASATPFFAHICDQYFYSSEWLTFTVCLFIVFPVCFWSLNSLLIFIECNDIPWIDKYRIQKRKPKLRFQPDIVNLMRNGVFQHQWRISFLLPFIYFLLNINGKVVIRSPIPSLSTIIWQLAACTFTDDFIFFWTHYLFHTRYLYERIHKKHHIFKQPTGVVAVLSDPIESFFQNHLGFWMAPILFKEKHIFTICLWIGLRTYESVNAHSGYEFPFLSLHYYIPWLALGTSHHDYHHQHGKMNYGSFFTLWDRFMNTYRLPKHE